MTPSCAPGSRWSAWYVVTHSGWCPACALVHSQPPPRPGTSTWAAALIGGKGLGPPRPALHRLRMVGEPLCLRPWQQKRVCLSPGCRLCLGKARQQLPYALRSCQRQAHSLRRWLELSRAEPRAEDQEAEQQVEEELQKVRRGRLGRLLGWASSQLAPHPPGGGADPAAGP